MIVGVSLKIRCVKCRGKVPCVHQSPFLGPTTTGARQEASDGIV